MFFVYQWNILSPDCTAWKGHMSTPSLCVAAQFWSEPPPPSHWNSHLHCNTFTLSGFIIILFAFKLPHPWTFLGHICIFLELPCLQIRMLHWTTQDMFVLTWGTLCIIAQVKKSLEATWNAVKTTEEGTRPEKVGWNECFKSLKKKNIWEKFDLYYIHTTV